MRITAYAVVSFLGLSVATASGATAADLSPAPSMAAPSFTGCHLGVHAGGVIGAADDWTPVTAGGAFVGESLGSHTVSGLAGGAQAGCDYQFASGLVLGLGGTVSLADAAGSHASTRETGVSYHSRTTAVGTAGARVGYAFDRVLGFVAGGLAVQRDTYQAKTTIIGTAYEAHDTRLGWTVGAGAEVLLSERVSIFARYDYANFGTDRIGLEPQVPGLRPASVKVTSDTNLVRAGINVRFGGPAGAR